jgi:hypothetical protein
MGTIVIICTTADASAAQVAHLALTACIDLSEVSAYQKDTDVAAPPTIIIERSTKNRSNIFFKI